MIKTKVKKSKDLYIKIALFAIVAFMGIICGTLLFFNSNTLNNSAIKQLYAETTVSTESELVEAISNAETEITLSSDITISSTLNLSNVTISGSYDLTVYSTGIINFGTNSAINVNALNVSGIINITTATVTIQNDVLITDSGVCNIICGTIDGNITVNSSGKLNFAEPYNDEISITGTITLDDDCYINIEYPIANSQNKFKVHINDATDSRVVVKYDKAITNAQVVVSTFQLLDNELFEIDKVSNGTGANAYYTINLISYSAVVNYVSYNGSDTLTGAPNIVVKLNDETIGTLTASNTSIIVGATSGTLTLIGNYIKLGSDITTNPTSLSEYTSQITTINGATAYSVYARDIYTITMDANGGSPDSTKYKVHGLTQTVSYATKPTLSHHEFANWNTQADGNGTVYENGANYTTNADLIVYAQWSNGNSNYTVKHYIMDTTGSYPANAITTEQKSGVFGSTLDVQDLIKNNLLATNGIEFDHAEVDNVIVTETTILEDGSRIINMYYERLQHTLTLSCGLGISAVSNGGVQTTNPVSYYYQEVVAIDATVESDDYVWYRWTGYQTKSSKSTTVQIPNYDIELTANANEEIQYDILVTVNNADYGSVDKTSFKAKNNSNITTSGNVLTVGQTHITATPNPNDAQWQYSFNNWTGIPVGGKVNTAGITITANFTRVKQSYTVTWKNWNNETLDTDIVEYGEYANWGDRPTPTRPDDEQWCNYQFSGWDGIGSVITGNRTITAIFYSDTLTQYTVRWLNDDNAHTELYSAQVGYGATPQYPYDTLGYPTKEDEYHTYTFVGWDKDITPVTSDQTYTAVYTSTTRTYTISWRNWDDSEFYSEQLEYQQLPQYSGPTPEKITDEPGVSYTFTGWSPAIVAVTQDATYTAQFEQSINKFTVTINVSPSGYGTVSQVSISVDYDTAISASGNVLTVGQTHITATTADDTAQYNYLFVGWNNIPANGKVTSAVTIIASFDRQTRSYAIYWQNEDGTPLGDPIYVAYGSVPSYPNNYPAPTKADDTEHTYTFAAWSPTLHSVSGEETYTATYNSAPRKYEIRWLNWDGTPLGDPTLVDYGSVPEYPSNYPAPTRPDGLDVSYEFAGWQPALSQVTGPATYIAKFNTTAIKYTVTIQVNNGEYGSVDFASVSVDYNTQFVVSNNVITLDTNIITATAQEDTAEYHYFFTNWANIPANGKVTSAVTITANFDREIRAYTIIWLNYNGTELDRDENALYNSAPSFTKSNPIRSATAEYTYTFAGWATTQNAEQGTEISNLPSVTGDATYYAAFSKVKNKYTISWLNWDGTPLCDPVQVEYGLDPHYSGETPKREREQDKSYTFIGWNPEVVAVEGNAEYTAVYQEAINQYTVTISVNNSEYGSVDEVSVSVDYDTQILVSNNVLTVGDIQITATESDETAQYHYFFTNWINIPANGKVQDDIEIIANFDRELKRYTITWINDDDDGTELYRIENIAYGEMPIYNGPAPTLPKTQEYEYIFNGWYPAMTTVKGNENYTAQYNVVLRKYTITWLNWDGTPLRAPTQVEYGSFPVYPDQDPKRQGDQQYEYEFVGWSPQLEEVTQDATYTAEFDEIINQYQIKIVFDKAKCITNPQLTIDINNQQIDITSQNSLERLFDYGTQISITALVQDNYNLSWSRNDIQPIKTSGLSKDVFVLQQDSEFTLYISQIFTVNVVYNSTMGTVEQGNSVSAICGDTVNLTATAKDGYKFVMWTKNGDFNAQDLNKTQAKIPNISSNCEIEAGFEVVHYKIKLFIDGVQTEIDYTINDQDIVLQTPTKDGFNFIGWTGSNGSTPQKTITVQAGSFGDKVFYANFSKPEGNEKLIIIIAVASAIVLTGVVITVIVVAKNKKGKRRRKTISIDLSRFK